jgi:hypothetical protein
MMQPNCLEGRRFPTVFSKSLDYFIIYIKSDVESGRDDSAFVQSAQELNDDLSSSSVIDYFKIANIILLLHDAEELYYDFRAGSHQDLNFTSISYLSLSGSLSVQD